MGGTDPGQRGGARRWIVRAVEDSLRRMNTDHIDLYQMHRADYATPVDETLAALSDLIRSGKVRAIGSSRFPPELIVEAQRTADRRGHHRRPEEARPQGRGQLRRRAAIPHRQAPAPPLISRPGVVPDLTAWRWRSFPASPFRAMAELRPAAAWAVGAALRRSYSTW
jgi:Aldo/keto reductase family